MNIRVRILIGFMALSVPALLPVTSAAQTLQAQPRSTQASAHTAAYETTKEVIVVGTVVSYSENGTSRPNGAHVVVQTPTGKVDVHLGLSWYLRTNNFTLAAGDAVNRGHDQVGLEVPGAHDLLGRDLTVGGRFQCHRVGR